MDVGRSSSQKKKPKSQENIQRKSKKQRKTKKNRNSKMVETLCNSSDNDELDQSHQPLEGFKTDAKSNQLPKIPEIPSDCGGGAAAGVIDPLQMRMNEKGRNPSRPNRLKSATAFYLLVRKDETPLPVPLDATGDEMVCKLITKGLKEYLSCRGRDWEWRRKYGWISEWKKLRYGNKLGSQLQKKQIRNFWEYRTYDLDNWGPSSSRFGFSNSRLPLHGDKSDDSCELYIPVSSSIVSSTSRLLFQDDSLMHTCDRSSNAESKGESNRRDRRNRSQHHEIKTVSKRMEGVRLDESRISHEHFSKGSKTFAEMSGTVVDVGRATEGSLKASVKSKQQVTINLTGLQSKRPLKQLEKGTSETEQGKHPSLPAVCDAAAQAASSFKNDCRVAKTVMASEFLCEGYDFQSHVVPPIGTASTGPRSRAHSSYSQSKTLVQARSTSGPQDVAYSKSGIHKLTAQRLKKAIPQDDTSSDDEPEYPRNPHSQKAWTRKRGIAMRSNLPYKASRVESDPERDDGGSSSSEVQQSLCINHRSRESDSSIGSGTDEWYDAFFAESC